MIVINDKDLPIEVAEKIITGTKPYETNLFANGICETIINEKKKQDMFDLEELKEIADYLMVYYNSHPQGEK